MGVEILLPVETGVASLQINRINECIYIHICLRNYYIIKQIIIT